MTTTRHYAAIDPDTRAVYGVGATPRDALRDAHANGARHEETELTSLEVVACTAAARLYVEEHGGQPTRALTVSRTGVSLRSEEG